MGKAMRTLRLAWEKVGNTRVGLHNIRTEMQMHRVVPGRLQVLAMAKMMEVEVISADFFDETISFYPRVRIMFESRERVEFIGAYWAKLSHLTNSDSSDYSEDAEILGKFPTLCIRRAFWYKRTNREIMNEFRSAPNKKDYIFGDKQTEINVSFVKLKDFPVLENLIADSTKLIRDGVNFEECPEHRTPYYDIHLTISGECINLKLLYEPNCVMSASLDNITSRWQRYLIDAPLEESMIPDEDFRVIYDRSILDCLRDFDLLNEPSD